MRILLRILVLLIIVLVPLAPRYVLSRLPFAEVLRRQDLSEWQTKQLEIYMETTKLLITLATLILGGVGFILGLTRDAQPKTLPTPGRVAMIAVSAGLSISFGYISHDMMVWMLSKRFFNLDTAVLYWSRVAQFWTFLVSLVLLAWAWIDTSQTQGRSVMKSTVLWLLTGFLAVAAFDTSAVAQSTITPLSGMQLESSVQTAVAQWASSRRCLYTHGTLKSITNSLSEARWALNSKAERYMLGPQKVGALVDAVVASYLDEVSIRTFGPLRRECVLDVSRLNSLAFQAASRLGPDVGYLTVDGTRRGAEIRIDSRLKGNIVQTFVLSVGAHRWQTMRCDDSVVIRADEHKKVYCRRQ